MMDYLYIYALIGFMASVIGYTWVEILTEPDHIFGWVKKSMAPLQEKRWIYEPTVGCPFCNAGQWALCLNVAYHIQACAFGGWELVFSIFSICLAIALPKLWIKILQ